MKSKALFYGLFLATVTMTTLSFTLRGSQSIKLNQNEINRVKALVNDFYNCSNEISENLPGSGMCRIRMSDEYFGGLNGCPINNDIGDFFSHGISSQFFANLDNYVMLLQGSGVQMTVESINPIGGEWTKELAPKMSNSDPDEYNVTLYVKKRIHGSNNKEKVVKQTVNVCLPAYNITGFLPGVSTLPVVSSNSDGVSNNSPQLDTEPGNYMTLAFQYYANKDYKEALQMFEKQIDLCGDPSAYYYSAIMYYKNQGCKGVGYRKRFEKFAQGMKVAADHGYKRAKFALNREGIDY